MPKTYKAIFPALMLVLAILACNMPGAQTVVVTATPDFVSTITAQASLLQSPPTGQTNTESTQPPAAAAPVTDTPAFTATNTLTSTPGVIMLTVSADTNCRSGPNKDYDYLGALLANESAEVVGKNTVTGYWIIKNPDGDGTCWLWGNYATVTGDVSKLSEVAVPPTPTPSMPAAVKNLKANKICFFNGVNYELNGFITWGDVSNEEGYRVYLNGGLFNTLPANETTSAIPALVLVPGGSIEMSVEAFNSAGKSPRKSVLIVCP